jgi:phage-related minor tail protein
MVNGAIQLGKDLVGGIVSGIKSAAGAVASAIADLIPGGGILGDIAGFVPGLAAGGPVSAGSPYIVGETGPELFVPTGSGTIMNNNRLGGLGGGGTMNVTVNMPVGSDGADVVAALQRYARAHGGTVPILTGQL